MTENERRAELARVQATIDTIRASAGVTPLSPHLQAEMRRTQVDLWAIHAAGRGPLHPSPAPPRPRFVVIQGGLVG